MHKRIVNEARIALEISPAGPLLIKASDQGADPTKPDMEFVETYHAGGRSVYLPGSSLKGAIRAHCERIVRTVSISQPNQQIWTCDPLVDRRAEGRLVSCGTWLDNERNRRGRRRNRAYTGVQLYNRSCTICRLFGNTMLASHLRVTDALPILGTEFRLEERNGVAIDRVLGSVSAGQIFNYQVLTTGRFQTQLVIKNFSLDQLGLLALTIRDFAEQRVGLGFAKSRGMGQVEVQVASVTVRYPAAVCENGNLRMLGGTTEPFANNFVLGAGALMNPNTVEQENETDGPNEGNRRDDNYAFPPSDLVEVDVHAQPDEWGVGATLRFDSPEIINTLWRSCVSAWQNRVEGNE